MFLSINFKYFLYSLTNLLSHNNSNQFSTLWNIKILLRAIQYYFKLKIQYFTANIFSFHNLFIIICLQSMQKKLLKMIQGWFCSPELQSFSWIHFKHFWDLFKHALVKLFGPLSLRPRHRFQINWRGRCRVEVFTPSDIRPDKMNAWDRWDRSRSQCRSVKEAYLNSTGFANYYQNKKFN